MSKRGWFLFAAMGVIWGMPYLLIKVADGGVPVPVLVFVRVAMGSLLLLPVALRGGQFGQLRGYFGWMAAFALIEIAGPFALLSNAEKHLPSSTSGLLVAAVPIFGAIIAVLLGSADRPTPVRWIGLLIGIGGVAVLAGPGAGKGGLVPVLEVLGTALGYAIGPQIASRKLADLPTVAVNAVCLGMAAVLYAPFAALTWPARVPSLQVIGALAGLGVICTAAAFLVFFRLIAEVGPARATVITYVNPAVAVALGVMVLGERLTPAIAVAFVLILGGSVLATRPGKPPATPVTEPVSTARTSTTVSYENNA
ncbi:MAG TPA: EamA family transporter [Streptosporangiaceae bacterium]|jgi:drug/metabolite transporter (DMT)-like permease